MKISGWFLVVMFAAFAMGLVGNLSSAEAGGNCQDKLAGNAYDCVEKESNGMTADLCWEFETRGYSSNFDLYLAGSTDYGCGCVGTGSFKSPKFDESSSKFECVGVDADFQWTGKVSGNKISGQGSAATGETLFFSCTKRTSGCSG